MNLSEEIAKLKAENEKLKGNFDIALVAVHFYALKDNWKTTDALATENRRFCVMNGIDLEYDDNKDGYGGKLARHILKQLGELK